MTKTGNRLKFFIPLLLVFAAALHTAQAADKAQVSVSASPNPVAADESLLLRLEVSGASGRIGKPTFEAPDFDVVGQSSAIQSTSQYVNGQFVMVGKYQYSFVLYPKKSGTHTIAKIRVPVGDDILPADDVIVQVRGETKPNASTQNAQAQNQNEDTGSNEPGQLNSDFTVYLSLNKKSAYVGEPIIAEYWLYDYANLVSQEIKRWPSFNGFWKEDLEIVNRYQFESAYVGMKRVRRALLGRFALYGIKPGRTNIDKLLVTGTHLVRTRPRGGEDDEDLFGFQIFGLTQQRTATNASQETSVEILPLPDQGKPANFGGTVGNFTVSLTAAKQSLEAHTPLNVQATYEGVGNFPSINEPKLSLPPEFEIFESNVAFKDSVPIGMKRPIANKKTFNFVLIPRKEGSYTIPPISFSFFDPKRKTYETVKSQSIAVQVTPNMHPQQQIAAAPPSSSIPANTTKPAATVALAGSILPYLNYAALALVGLGAIFGLVWFGRRLWKQFKAKTARKEKTGISWTMFKKAKDAPSANEVCAAAREFLRNSVNAKIGMNPQGMLREDLAHRWSDLQYPQALLESYHKLIVQIDSMQFGGQGFSAQSKAHLLSEIEAFGNAISKVRKP